MSRNILTVKTLAPIWKPDAFKIEFINKNPVIMEYSKLQVNPSNYEHSPYYYDV